MTVSKSKSCTHSNLVSRVVSRKCHVNGHCALLFRRHPRTIILFVTTETHELPRIICSIVLAPNSWRLIILELSLMGLRTICTIQRRCSFSSALVSSATSFKEHPCNPSCRRESSKYNLYMVRKAIKKTYRLQQDPKNLRGAGYRVVPRRI